MSLVWESGRLRLLCVWMAYASAALALGLMTTAIVVWFHPDFALAAARESANQHDGPIALTWPARLVSGLVSCAHLGLLCWALWAAKGLFQNFADGHVFTIRTGQDLRLIGGLIAAYAVLTPLKGSLVTIAITMGNPPGHRQLAIGLSSNELILGVLGALILVLGHVMAEAARIADDNRQIV